MSNPKKAVILGESWANKQACIRGSYLAKVGRMGLPTQPVTLSAQQVQDLNKQLSTLRHDINGDLALVVASAELVKLNPEVAARMLATLLEQPPKIREKIDKFAAELEKVLSITRP